MGAHNEQKAASFGIRDFPAADRGSHDLAQSALSQVISVNMPVLVVPGSTTSNSNKILNDRHP